MNRLFRSIFIVFLSEILDSMTRCFQENSNPEFLILEINSSRYAYVMSLKEVNVNVVKAMFSLPVIKNSTPATLLPSLNNVLKQLGPVLQNYIKDQDAMFDCLKGLEVSEIREISVHIQYHIYINISYIFTGYFPGE